MIRSRAIATSLALALAWACSPRAEDGAPGPSIDPTGIGGSPPSAFRVSWPRPLIDPNEGGSAPALYLTGLAWGRLVDVYALEPVTGARRLVYPDFVIGESIASDGINYELVSVHGSQEVQLTILHRLGSSPFERALARLQDTLIPIQDATLPPFAQLPRNAAIELRFQDLLDAGTVTAETVRLAVGYPPEQLFEARVLPDPNHGDLADPDGDGESELFTTRVIIDLAVSELESAQSDPPLPMNALGLPSAVTTNAPNVQLRLPTRTAPAIGQTQILRNLAGNGLSFTGNGSRDPSVPTRDIVRSARSGGESVGDLYAGFLRDDEGPSIVGSLEVTLSGATVPDPDRPGVYTFTALSYADPACAPSPESGDRLQIGGVWTVLEGYAQQAGAHVTKPRVRVVHPPGAVPAAGAAVLTTLFEAAQSDCWLGFEPPAALPPNLGVSPAASVLLSFSEPMDASSLAPFEGYVLSRTPLAPDAFQLVVGHVDAASDARTFFYVPSLPLAHAQGSSEAYYVQLGDGAAAPTDLAGNPLAQAPDNMLFTLDRSAASHSTGGLVFRFESIDEIYGDGLPELRGQHVLDLQEGAVEPRPVTRFSIAADVDKPVPSAMIPFPPGVQTPLVPLGCKLQSLWRYCDLGFGYADETVMNVDVEGLAWAPVGGQAVADQFDELSISLGHSSWLPDEHLNPMTGFPAYPISGLDTTYAENFVPSDGGTGTVVHPRERGYTVNPADLFTSESGKLMMPWPLNRGIPIEEFEYYTWRDTGVLDAAGAATSGYPLLREIELLGLPPHLIASIYQQGAIKTVGLPLLVEYRCYPDANALGLNAFQILLAANSSARPNFRAYSAGGTNSSGQTVILDPDQADEASGGFNPNSIPPGQATMPTDNAFTIGQADLVTRVSRAHSIWLPAGGAPASFAPEVLVSSRLPAGTQVRVEWRGASAINLGPGVSHITTDAALLDYYGDPWQGVSDAPAFLADDPTWKDEPAALDGASWMQFRLTFVGDPIRMETANADALGLAWTN